MTDAPHPADIPRELAEARLQQGLALLDFWTEIWAANPHLARQAGRRVEEFMMPRDEVQRRYAKEWENQQ
jgi:hypothetical protein